MKPCIQLSFTEDWRAKLKDAAGAGFARVAWALGTPYFNTMDPRAAAEVLGYAMHEEKVQCVQTHLPCYDIFRDCGEVEEAVERQIENGIVLSGMLGAEAAVLHPRSASAHSYSTRLAEEALRRDLERYLPIAERHRTAVAIENLTVFPDHSDLLFYGSRYEELARIVDEYATPHFGICWDTGHANLIKLNQAEVIRELGSRIIATHIHNNYGFHDDHALPTSGSIDFVPIMHALFEIGYDKALCLEARVPVEGIRLSFFRHAEDCLFWLLAMREM